MDKDKLGARRNGYWRVNSRGFMPNVPEMRRRRNHGPTNSWATYCANDCAGRKPFLRSLSPGVRIIIRWIETPCVCCTERWNGAELYTRGPPQSEGDFVLSSCQRAHCARVLQRLLVTVLCSAVGRAAFAPETGRKCARVCHQCR